MLRKMRCLLINPDVLPVEIDLTECEINTYNRGLYHKMYTFVEGPFDAVILGSLGGDGPDNRILYESGYSKSAGGILQGDFIITGLDSDGGYASLTQEQIVIYSRLYGKNSIREVRRACGL